MKKFKISLIFTLASVACACLALVACERDNYVQHYVAEDCTLEVAEFNNNSNRVTYGKSFPVGDTVLYFGVDINSGRIIDGWIDRVKKFNDILNLKEFDSVKNIYISDKVIANFNCENEISMSFKPDTSEEEAFAWILQAVSNNDLPYGIYAGLSSSLIEKEEYSNFAHSSIGTVGYLTELQFPAYEKDNLPENERTYAWSLSNYIVGNLIKSGKSEKAVAEMARDELNIHLLNEYGIVLPDYMFMPHSTKYEYRVEQDCFTYYINKNFVDLILPKNRFTTTYNYLADWLKDNADTTKKTNLIFGVGNMYPINVYLDKGVTEDKIGDIGNDCIYVMSAGLFSQGYIKHVLIHRGINGNIREVAYYIHANTSKYANLMWYYLFSGSASNYVYLEEISEKASYKETTALYNKLNAVPISEEKFDYWFFADCYSALYSIKGQRFVSKLQTGSLIRFIAKEYGEDYAWELNFDTSASINGKTFDDLKDEWFVFLKNIK